MLKKLQPYRLVAQCAGDSGGNRTDLVSWYLSELPFYLYYQSSLKINF